ncbi:uncharacterized protein AB9W97_012008 [Spinachia spinachia]
MCIQSDGSICSILTFRAAIFDHRCRAFIIIQIPARYMTTWNILCLEGPLMGPSCSWPLPRLRPSCGRAPSPLQRKEAGGGGLRGRAHVLSKGCDIANAALVPSRWKVQFGRGRHQLQGRRWRTPSSMSGAETDRGATSASQYVFLKKSYLEHCVIVNVLVCNLCHTRPLVSALTAFVSGRRSLSAVEMQAQVKKLVAPQPVSTAPHLTPFRPALSSPRSFVEPSDEELVKAVVGFEMCPKHNY